jgi:hypothetical protein
MNQQFRRQAAVVAVNQAVDRRARVNARRAAPRCAPGATATPCSGDFGHLPRRRVRPAAAGSTATELRRESTVLAYPRVARALDSTASRFAHMSPVDSSA